MIDIKPSSGEREYWVTRFWLMGFESICISGVTESHCDLSLRWKAEGVREWFE